MKILLCFLFLFFSFLHSEKIALFCIDSSLNLAMSADCSDLRLFKLPQNLCQSDFQKVLIDPSQIQKLPFSLQNSLSLSLIPLEELKEFPKLMKFISEFCPYEAKFLNFFGLRDENADPYGINMVYFRLMNASGLSGDNKTTTYQDYFQNAPFVHQYEFEARRLYGFLYEALFPILWTYALKSYSG